MTEHTAIARFREELRRRGGTGRIVVLPDSVHTARLAAEALGCEVGAIANSLLFRTPSAAGASGRPDADLPADPGDDPADDPAADPAADSAADPGHPHAGAPVLLLTSGAHRVDTAVVARHLGVPALERATPEFVRRHTGQVIGGVSPFDHPAPLRTYLDPWLRHHPEIWAAAGHPAAVFSSTFEELRRLTGATEIDMA